MSAAVRWANRPWVFRYSPTGFSWFVGRVIRHLPSTTSYSGNTPVSVARRPMAIVCSEEYFQPGGHGAKTWRNRGPFMSRAFSTFRTKSSGKLGFTVAA